MEMSCTALHFSFLRVPSFSQTYMWAWLSIRISIQFDLKLIQGDSEETFYTSHYDTVFLIVLGWLLYLGCILPCCQASLVLRKQKKTLLLQQWGIQKQVNSWRWNNMSGRNSSGPLWDAHTTLMTKPQKRRAWTGRQSHFYTQKWTRITGK